MCAHNNNNTDHCTNIRLPIVDRLDVTCCLRRKKKYVFMYDEGTYSNVLRVHTGVCV